MALNCAWKVVGMILVIVQSALASRRHGSRSRRVMTTRSPSEKSSVDHCRFWPTCTYGSASSSSFIYKAEPSWSRSGGMPCRFDLPSRVTRPFTRPSNALKNHVGHLEIIELCIQRRIGNIELIWSVSEMIWGRPRHRSLCWVLRARQTISNHHSWLEIFEFPGPNRYFMYGGRLPFTVARASWVNPYTKLSFSPSFVVRAAV
jgi:hypothetical protein